MDNTQLLAEFFDWEGFTSLSDDTQRTYRQHLWVISREIPSFVAMTRDQLRAWDKKQRGADSAINVRIAAIGKLCKFMVARGYQESDPSNVLRRRTGRGRPIRYVTRLGEKRAKLSPQAQLVFDFLYHSGLRLREALSVKARVPVESPILVQRGKRFEEVPINRAALDALEGLGGSVDLTMRTIETWFRAAGFSPQELRKTALRDHQMTGQAGDLPLVITRLHEFPQLAAVEMSIRKALLEMQPGGDPGDAITDAGTALQEMLVGLGLKGNSLGPLLDQARAKGLFGPRGSELAVAIGLVADWVRSERNIAGDTHRLPSVDPEDAWLMIRVAVAIIMRLMPSS